VQAQIEEAIRQWLSPRDERPALKAHRRANAVICVTPSFAEEAKSLGVPAERVHVIPNAVDLGRVRARAAEAPTLEPASAPRLLAVGRLSAEKGFDVLIRAHAEVLREGLPHELAILGEGPLRTSLEALAGQLGVSRSVVLPGFVSNPLPSVADASLFVLSSRREGLALALLEALALGVPIVATRCGDGAELILGDGAFGKLVTPGSVDELAEAIAAHLRDPQELRQRAGSAATHVDRFDLQRVSAEYLQVLEQVTMPVGRPRPARVEQARPATAEPVELSVVVAVRNGITTLADQLDALLAQEAPVEWELVVSDNGSTDGSWELVTRYVELSPLVRLVDSSQHSGLSYARNFGTGQARGRSVAFCDQDDIVAPGWLAGMAEALRGHELVAGRLEHELLNPPWTIEVRGRPQASGPVEYAEGWPAFAFGCTLGVRKELHERLGGFDETFVRGAEDADYCWRAQQAGTELVLVDDAVTHYRYRHSMRGVYRQAREYGESEAQLYAKHRPLGLPPAPRPVWRALRLWAATARSFVRARTRGGLGVAVWLLGQRVGRLRGSIRGRVLLP
jgi:GT2 family glycosyltransferase